VPRLLILDVAVREEDVPRLPMSDGLSAISVFVSLISAISVFVSIIQTRLP